MDPAAAATIGSVTELLKFGIAGVFILVLIVAVIVLWRANVALTNQLAKNQEERLVDVRKCTEALLTAAQATNKQAEELQGLSEALMRRGGR